MALARRADMHVWNIRNWFQDLEYESFRFDDCRDFEGCPIPTDVPWRWSQFQGGRKCSTLKGQNRKSFAKQIALTRLSLLSVIETQFYQCIATLVSELLPVINVKNIIQCMTMCQCQATWNCYLLWCSSCHHKKKQKQSSNDHQISRHILTQDKAKHYWK